MALMFGRVLIMARLLSVEEFAVLNTVLLISVVVGMMAALGLLVELQRKLPVQLERRQIDAALSQIAVTVLGSVAASVLVLLILFGVSMIWELSRSVILAGVVHGVTQQVFIVVATESRSNGDTVRYSIQTLARATLILVFAVPIAILTRSAIAVLLMEALVAAVLSVLMLRSVLVNANQRARDAFGRGMSQVRQVNWASMAALVAATVVVTMAGYVDRWLAVWVLSVPNFAEYSFASIALVIAQSLQILVNASVFPALARRRALRGPRSAFRLAAVTAGATLAGCGLVAVPCLVIAAPVIDRYFPGYGGALPLLPVVAVTACFRISDFWTGFLLVDGRERGVVLINIPAVAAAILVWYGFCHGVPTALNLAYLAAGVAAARYCLSFVFCVVVTMSRRMALAGSEGERDFTALSAGDDR